MLWMDLGGRTKGRTTKELQEQDPLGSPHLEEKLSGGNVDLGLLSCFPKDGQESFEGLRGIKLTRFATMEERGNELSKSEQPALGEEGGYL